ncbi:MAG: DUF5110 domain-containing protein [Chitinophagaceae bacterium]|nr:DUF5110 domain-containing protein [Chitinophagaceae bacterium]
MPEGKWINYWTGEQLSGNAKHTVAAPVNQIPLFVKQGSVIPMRKYASSIEKGDNNTLMLHVYPGANGHFNLIEDDGTSNDYLRGVYASTIIEMKKFRKIYFENKSCEGNFPGMNKTEMDMHIHSIEMPRKVC